MPEVKSVVEWARWKAATTPAFLDDEKELWLILWARTAMGETSLEDRLIRLMVWVGATFEHLPEHNGLEKPLDILKARTAWCEQQCKVFCFLAYHILHVPGRLVSAKHTEPPPGGVREGHTMAEVFYVGAWHLFDVHKDHQTVYRDYDGHIMSYEELRAAPEVVKRRPHWWVAANGDGKDGFYRSDAGYTYYSLEDTWQWPWPTKP